MNPKVAWRSQSNMMPALIFPESELFATDTGLHRQIYTVDTLCLPTETKHPVNTLATSSEADRESLAYFLVPIYP